MHDEGVDDLLGAFHAPARAPLPERSASCSITKFVLGELIEGEALL